MARHPSLEDDLAEAAMLRNGEEVVRCPSCHRALFDGVPSCPYCGTKFGRLAPRNTAFVVAVVVVIVLVVLAAFIR